MVLLYHYTDRAGKDGIYADQLIHATDARDGLGKVVRFTELPHDTDKAKLIANNWGRNPPWNAIEKLKFWFKFEDCDLPQPTYQRSGVKDRNVWVCEHDVPLRQSGRPTPAPGPTTPSGKTYYHYTNKEGRDAINKQGYISPAKSGWGSAKHVALTDVLPTEDKAKIVWHMFGEKNATSDLLGKTKYWFKFDESELRDLKRDKDKTRRLWVTPIAVTTKPVATNTSGGPPHHSHHAGGGQASHQEKSPAPKRRRSPQTLPWLPQSQHSSTFPHVQRATLFIPVGGAASQATPFNPIGGGSRHAPPAALLNSTALYYYTDRAGKDDIFSNGCIAARGGSVYLYEAKPAQVPSGPAIEYWFEFPDSSLPGVQHGTDPQGGTAWIVGQDVDLALSTKQGRLAA